MLNIVFYFQVHQPYRLRPYKVLDIGTDHNYFDERLNREVVRKVGDKCYLPANRMLLELIDRFEGRFKVAFSISGVAIEQFRAYYPEVLASFHELARTGCVEFLGETYYHSLTALFDRDEFISQVRQHRSLMEAEFGVRPIVFRNTELIYQDQIADLIWEEEGFKVILAEGADKVLCWRKPLYAYHDYNHRLFLLLKYYTLSDDIAFRFSDRGWIEHPLTAEKFVSWVDQLTVGENGGRNLFLNLFMDFETFGEHQWEDSGIFGFMRHLPGRVLEKPHLAFAWPSDVIDIVNYDPEPLSFTEPVSWADSERDLSAWLDNEIQRNAAEAFFALFPRVRANGDPELLATARRLSTSDHFYYMSTKYFQDGDVHKYFSPYDAPEQGYLYYINALADLEERLG
ncbi:MAG: glycoside hydrolase family 57 protein [Deltaproteobacteria bacterium]|nr:glycoside hydrolase family 57 protein [Candidatus Anaeroferrophillacea bacterium]